MVPEQFFKRYRIVNSDTGKAVWVDINVLATILILQHNEMFVGGLFDVRESLYQFNGWEREHIMDDVLTEYNLSGTRQVAYRRNDEALPVPKWVLDINQYADAIEDINALRNWHHNEILKARGLPVEDPNAL